MAPCLSLIIPIYNGAPYLPQTFQDLEKFFSRKDWLKEIIFVNDGSTDTTSVLLEQFKKKTQLSIRLVQLQRNQGKGHALKAGIEMCRGADFFAFTDVELPYGLPKVEEGYEFLKNNPETVCVAGERVHTGSRQYSFYRSVGSKLFRLFLPKIIHRIPDTQCGLKMFRSREGKKLFKKIRTGRWVFDIEIFLFLLHSHFIPHFIPVHIKPSCAKGKGGVQFLRNGKEILKELKRIRAYEKQGLYNHF